MSCTVRIPTPLLRYCGGTSTFEVEAPTVGEVLDRMWKLCPDLERRLCDEHGEVRGIVSIYLNDDDIRSLDEGATVVKDGDEIYLLPIVTGG